MNNTYQTITLDVSKEGIATVTMIRAELHNAFNAEMIQELTNCYRALSVDMRVKLIVLRAEGRSFSAGADINWMKSMVNATERENRQDSERLAELLRAINFCKKPTLARVQGLALGGGVGLLCCCDIVVASDRAKFGLTETKLGLVPAVISPYVVDAIGTRQARRYFLTAEVFGAERAEKLGLASIVCAEDDLDTRLNEQIEMLLATGPNAKEICKKLVQSVVGRTEAHQKKLDEYTTQVIAAVRVSEEGQNGLNAFLNKETPKW
ncbi:enoyl-CoA hydratase-related protein [Marinicella sp. W31]|uniref:enoyl-CoA hydratase-related protein n=1 Tax=Marinicella sp. W31 TaxID=3023713 RepID=UPI003757818A